MGVDSFFNKWFSKDGKLSLPLALQVSAFFFFADLCLHRANVRLFTPWVSAAENVPPLLITLFAFLALYSMLSGHLLPFFFRQLTFLVPASMSSESGSDYEARRSVLEDQYERFAVETNNAAMLAHVSNIREEPTRHFRNSSLFLIWMWLAWAEVRFCLSVSGTIGNHVLPLPSSPWVNGIGALVCFGITVLWIVGYAKDRSSLRIRVSQKLRWEIEEREKGPTTAAVKNPNQDHATFSPLNFPSEPMIGVARAKRQSGT